MKDRHKWIILSLFVIILAGCGTAKRASVPPVATTGSPSSGTDGASETNASELVPPPAMHVAGYKAVEGTLVQAFQDWQGTPYEWGGATINGVDCSAFVQIVFNQYFGVELPRTTRKLLYQGQQVRRNSLQPGDLVFFKTGRKMLHVGIIM